MRVLLYENRKSDPIVWNASSPEKEAAAYLALFTQLDKNLVVYRDLDNGENILDRHYILQMPLLLKAREGNADAAKTLLQLRRNYEYEFFMNLEVYEP